MPIEGVTAYLFDIPLHAVRAIVSQFLGTEDLVFDWMSGGVKGLAYGNSVVSARMPALDVDTL